MKNHIFRQSAWQRLSSPEQLDQLLTVTSPRSWLALLALGILLSVFILWSVVGSIPVTLSGVGILLRGGVGFNHVISNVEGVVTDIYVDVGDVVKANQVVGILHNPLTDKDQEILSVHKGRVTERRVAANDYVLAGESILIIEPDTSDHDLEAIIYVNAEQGANIERGMTVHVVPASVNAEETGVILGYVESISPYPESRDSMYSLLKNDELVSFFFSRTDETPIGIHVSLIPDITDVDAYKWSTGVQPDIVIRHGSLADANIILGYQQPIKFIGLDFKLGDG